MAEATPDHLPADVRHRLRSLAIVARRAAGDRGIGLHASPARGSGIEFAQYRAYEQGDEPARIDWRLYARSDRFFVREAERESPLTLWILVDASASLGQADHGGSRLAAARGVAAAALAELALAQGDRFGLGVLGGGDGGGGVRVVAPAVGLRQRDRVRLALGGIVPAGGFADEAALRPMRERIGPRDMVVMLGDWFDPACLGLAERLSRAGREVIAIQLLTVGERDFPYAGGYRFRDPESGETLPGDAAALRADYLERFAAARAALHAAWRAAAIRHAELVTGQPLDAPLRALFGRVR